MDHNYLLIKTIFIAIAILLLLLTYLSFSIFGINLDRVYLYMGCTFIVLAIFSVYIGGFGGFELVGGGSNR